MLKNNIDEDIKNIPKYVFIVPYRDRLPQLICYINHMKYILEDLADNFQILICHQYDSRPFNRGAMKNLGFIYVKNKFPNTYKDIILIYQDIDTLPSYKNMFNFDVEKNNIKHFYGFKQTLGGLFCVKAETYEYLNGFPNFWEWGYEDNCLYKRCYMKKININRDDFYDINSDKFLQLSHGLDNRARQVNSLSKDRFINDLGSDGIITLQNINYIINDTLDLPYMKELIVVDFMDWYIPETHKNINLVSYNKQYVYSNSQRKNYINSNTNISNNVVSSIPSNNSPVNLPLNLPRTQVISNMNSIRRNELKRKEELKKKYNQVKKPVALRFNNNKRMIFKYNR
jgi:hypothetical protein